MSKKNLDLSNYVEVVEFINSELLKGRSMRDIEENSLGLANRIMVKRLNRKGYKRVGNKFELTSPTNTNSNTTQVIQKNDNSKKIVTPVAAATTNNINLTALENINLTALNELIQMLEPLKVLLQEFDRSKNVIEVQEITLNVTPAKAIKQKQFKVDTEVLERWEVFINKYNQYKVQDLISMAITEFIVKYDK